MNENLNLIEILKDCPKGIKLYSSVFGEVKFDCIKEGYSNYPIRIILKNGAEVGFASDGTEYAEYKGECVLFPSKKQRDWSKFKIKRLKFDPKTLKPFDNVLVRDSNLMTWECELFSYIKQDEVNYPYVCMYHLYKYCIPYNEDSCHLVGTTNKAPKFYRYWKD